MTIDEQISRHLAAAGALADRHQYREAFDLLVKLKRNSALLPQAQIHPTLYARLKQDLWRYAPQWWKPIESGGYQLRRCQADDATFYESCFADPTFTTRYNRQQGWKGDLAAALDKNGRLPPVDLKALAWIVCRSDGRRIGLATLSSINSRHRRAELSLGIPGRPAPVRAGLIASLLAMHFAFFVVRLHKLQCNIYDDNPAAMRNVEKIGFRREGVLIDQILVPGKGYMHIHQFGQTVTQIKESPVTLELARRFLGEDWSGKR